MRVFLNKTSWRIKAVAISCMAVVCLTVTGYGQGFGSGFRAGITASEVSGDKSGGANKLGLFAAIYTEYALSERSFWHLELLYIQKGSREFNDPEDPDDPRQGPFRDYTFSLQYVEVPILYKIHFPVLGGLRLTKHLGGEIGLSFSHVVGHYETNDFGDEITQMMAETRPFRPAELNIIAGFNVPIGTNFVFNARLTQGLTPLRDHASGKQTWYNRGQYNTCWSFGLSYSIF